MSHGRQGNETPTAAPSGAMWVPVTAGRDKPVYLAIADAIADDIAAGILTPGQRLPPQRHLAALMGIDFTTVSRAYVEARHRGLIDARVGQGTFVRAAAPAGPARPEPVPMPGPVSGLVDMTMNQPPVPADPALLERMRAGMAAALPAGLSGLLHYPDGLDPDAEADGPAAAAAWLAPRLPGVPADRLLTAPGTQGALLALLTLLTQPGDTVCTEALTYPGFKAAAAQRGLRVVGVPMDGDGIDPGALDRCCAEHGPALLYCTPTLHNPTTATMPEDRRRAVAAVVQRHGLPVLEDDVYGPLPATPIPPLAAFAPDQVFHIAGLAKCLSPQVRIAYVAAPSARQALRLGAVLRGSALMPSPITAAVARRWIADGTAAQVLGAIRAEAVARRAMAASLLPPGSTIGPAEAYHVWLPLPAVWPRADFAAYLRTHGIAAVTADAFAADGTSPVPEALRLCLGAAHGRDGTRRMLAVVAEALDRLPAAPGTVI
ncbi:DNA-binding transcriptional MocR family regulator [Azospirillum fermentarium]|uniref:aminotransferase-like domain-containing protein n=1 Tax=Azospirillum fermentarium TaxID=1233114 RepID=UPI002225CBE0|nr:PLP-dependent aminotransferase family protein [Azospirillum fermentarium]MCW2245802.1 DNA-binding transcriptional MocR family regulator [Azospirillum fermentarium]